MIVSVFSGALGLDQGVTRGLESVLSPAAAGQLHAGVTCELNTHAHATIRAALPQGRHYRDVSHLRPGDWADLPWARPDAPDGGRPLILLGGPPCQPFSTSGRRQALSDPRGSLFMDYVRLIHEARPRFFVMENVRGLLSASVRHRPLNRRGAGHPPLEPDEQPGSVMATILQELNATGYELRHALLQAADYGAPQTRQRLLILGSRDHEGLEVPPPTHGQNHPDLKPWVTLGETLDALHDPHPEFPRYTPARAALYAQVPPGGNWRDLPVHLHAEALGGALNSGGGRAGFCRRLSRERPSPTVMTSPNQRSTGLCHPDHTRPLSLRECAALQGFPPDWPFQGPLTERYRQVGNAVPLHLGQAVGRSLAQAMQKTRRLRQAAD